MFVHFVLIRGRTLALFEVNSLGVRRHGALQRVELQRVLSSAITTRDAGLISRFLDTQGHRFRDALVEY